MESEHRELGIGDPTLGRTVRKLVSMLAKRTQQWRTTGEDGWTEPTGWSLYKNAVAGDALEHSADALKRFAQRLEATPLERLKPGRIA
jgi:cytochrome b pre-mRNA-processing protein 3